MKYAICLALASACLLAQQPISFEVASVKMKPPGSEITMVGLTPSGPRLTVVAMTLSDLISWAYDVKAWQVAGGPEWAGFQKDRSTLDSGARRFDIIAKAAGDAPASRDDLRQMLQSLLTDRFHLVLHHESRETPVYAFVTDKKGPKFHESAADANGVLRMYGAGKITATGGTITQLAGWLSNNNGVDRPVVDQTGLTGRYNYTLEWSNPLAADSDSAPSIFTAVQEQLGLRLEPRRAPIDVLVIDHAELPGEN